MSRVLITGSAGFIGGYVVQELLRRGHEVIGVDNLSKYGPVARSYDHAEGYPIRRGRRPRRRAADAAARRMRSPHRRRRHDRRDLLLPRLRLRPARHQRADHGGDVRRGHRGPPRPPSAEGHLHQLLDGLRDRADSWPSDEGQEHRIPPPHSSYGFQKLAVEYFARAAHDQHGLPFTIVRPFNCVGIGEAARPRRRRGAERQRQAGHEPRGPGPGPEGAARARIRCTSWATAPRSATTPTVATSPRAS